jgi:type VI secretion system secreted protein VgrG
LEGGLNTFLYAEASPVMYSDPEGLNPIAIALGVCRISPSLCVSAGAATAVGVQSTVQGMSQQGLPMSSSQSNAPSAQQVNVCVAGIVAEPPGNCTPEEHRDLQDRVENACGSAIACRGGDDIATLNRKIGAHSACIDARKRINDRCFGGGDEQHQRPIQERQGSIRRCQDLMTNMGGGESC